MSTKRQRKRCRYCRKIFHPDPRVGNQQKACSDPSCRKSRKRQAQREWVEKNQDYFKGRYENTRQWLEAHPGYLESYRKSHPPYVQRNRKKQKQRRIKKSRKFNGESGRVDIQDTIITQPVANAEDKSKLVTVDIQDAIMRQIIVPVYVTDILGHVDIQDDIGKGPIGRYTPMRIITRMRLKQFMTGYPYAGR